MPLPAVELRSHLKHHPCIPASRNPLCRLRLARPPPPHPSSSPAVRAHRMCLTRTPWHKRPRCASAGPACAPGSSGCRSVSCRPCHMQHLTCCAAPPPACSMPTLHANSLDKGLSKRPRPRPSADAPSVWRSAALVGQHVSPLWPEGTSLPNPSSPYTLLIPPGPHFPFPSLPLWALPGAHSSFPPVPLDLPALPFPCTSSSPPGSSPGRPACRCWWMPACRWPRASARGCWRRRSCLWWPQQRCPRVGLGPAGVRSEAAAEPWATAGMGSSVSRAVPNVCIGLAAG
jgi:hypothetical protein